MFADDPASDQWDFFEKRLLDTMKTPSLFPHAYAPSEANTRGGCIYKEGSCKKQAVYVSNGYFID
jgi:hypothetical protein